MTPLHGTYGGEDYELLAFPTDDGVGAWFVQRAGGDRHEVRLKPPSCTCGWWIWKLKGLSWRRCRHIQAASHILKGVKDGGE